MLSLCMVVTFFFPHGPFGAATWMLLFVKAHKSVISFVTLIFVTDNFRRDSVSSA